MKDSSWQAQSEHACSIGLRLLRFYLLSWAQYQVISTTDGTSSRTNIDTLWTGYRGRLRLLNLHSESLLFTEWPGSLHSVTERVCRRQTASVFIIRRKTAYLQKYKVNYRWKRQAMYMSRNTEKSSCNHCCSRKAIRITYSEYVFVALFIQHAKRLRRIVLFSVACPTLPYFSTLSHKRHDFL